MSHSVQPRLTTSSSYPRLDAAGAENKSSNGMTSMHSYTNSNQSMEDALGMSKLVIFHSFMFFLPLIC